MANSERLRLERIAKEAKAYNERLLMQAETEVLRLRQEAADEHERQDSFKRIEKEELRLKVETEHLQKQKEAAAELARIQSEKDELLIIQNEEAERLRIEGFKLQAD